MSFEYVIGSNVVFLSGNRVSETVHIVKVSHEFIRNVINYLHSWDFKEKR